MHQLVYLSTAAVAFDLTRFLALQVWSQTYNFQHGITGMLIYRDGFFIQALEGTQDAVSILMSKIRNDSRHRAILVLREGPVPERDFPDWTMGFRDLSGKAFQDVAGLSFDPVRTDASMARRLLRTFREEGPSAQSRRM